MNLTQATAAQTMSSREIAELVEKRHDNVKRTIETLSEQGVIVRPQIEDEHGADALGRPRVTQVYRFSGERGKRDSIIVVAQLCPEFTARLVDRWQELEARVAQPSIPQTLPEALRLAAEAIERNEKLALENKAQAEALAKQAPKVEALERFSENEGRHNTRNAAKMLGFPEKKTIAWLLTHGWYYRDHAGRLCAKAEKIAAGYLDTTPIEIQRSDGIQTVAQPVITQRGLVKLGELLAKDGLLPKQEAFLGGAHSKSVARLQTGASA